MAIPHSVEVGEDIPFVLHSNLCLSAVISAPVSPQTVGVTEHPVTPRTEPCPNSWEGHAAQ